jgi:ferrous iron transport protein A
MRISELEIGNRARLVGFGQTSFLYRRRLLSMGITRGVEILIIRVAPFGCPIQVEVRGTALTLRKEEAAELIWEHV